MPERLFVIGLGNPGPDYGKTRHNIGKIVVDHLKDQFNIKMSPGRGRFYIGAIGIEETELYIVTTTTWMNLSGEAVRDLVMQFQALPEELLVVCDDFNLPFENIRLRLGGSDGGQKGLRSIIEILKTPKIPRLRIGIASQKQFEAIDFVLGEFSEMEFEKLPEVIKRAEQCVITIIKDGSQKAMSLFNKRIVDMNNNADLTGGKEDNG